MVFVTDVTQPIIMKVKEAESSASFFIIIYYFSNGKKYLQKFMNQVTYEV
jgi:hypothetical protein